MAVEQARIYREAVEHRRHCRDQINTAETQLQLEVMAVIGTLPVLVGGDQLRALSRLEELASLLRLCSYYTILVISSC